MLVPSLGRMYDAIYKKGLALEFRKFMLGEKKPLGQWLQNNGFSVTELERIKRYELDAGDFFIPSDRNPDRTKPPKDIAAFIKDPYGSPYVPGSSLKGAVRSALLAHLVKSNPSRFEEVIDDLERGNDGEGKRDRYLSKTTREMEEKAFHTLGRNEKRTGDAVNSVMAGLIVSDSKPLSLKQLTLCQKIDVTLDGNEKGLPILREMLKPSTIIEFQITIDTTLFPYDMDTIVKALNEFNSVYYDRFGAKFNRGDPQPGIIWVGGGAGYATKTVVYSLFDEPTALRVADRVFNNTLGKNYLTHHHNKDIGMGTAPHIYKCTRYQGTLYDVGMCKLVSVDES